MENRFEKIYGRLFRSYAKSIIEEISKITQVKENLLTVGILQYRSYDNSFHYAPTLKNIFVSPADEILNGNFPTHNNRLWNYKLMVSLAKYFHYVGTREWIKEIFEENAQLEKNHASIFAASYPDYKKFRNKWKTWFEKYVDNFENILEEDTSLLNHLFYFANYLISITQWPAYTKTINDESSYAQNIYTCVRLYKYAVDVNKKFNTRGAYIEDGIHMSWNNHAYSTYFKASLLFVLEVCFKQPFDVDTKIRIIDEIRTSLCTTSTLYINVVEKPLFKSGEFLGICYVTWASDSKNEFENSYAEIRKTIDGVLDNSKISSLLYKEQISVAKFYLQNIDSNYDIDKPTIQRVFDIAHVFSSAPIIAYIESDSLHIKFLRINSNKFEYKEIKPEKTKDELFSFLSRTANIGIDDLNNNPVLWIDTVKTEITNDTDYTDIEKEITSFNNEIGTFISDPDFKHSEYFQITNITLHNFENDGEKSCLIF